MTANQTPTTVTQHIVKMICKDGGKLNTYYADTREDAEAFLASLPNPTPYVIEIGEVEMVGDAEFFGTK